MIDVYRVERYVTHTVEAQSAEDAIVVAEGAACDYTTVEVLQMIDDTHNGMYLRLRRKEVGAQ